MNCDEEHPSGVKCIVAAGKNHDMHRAWSDGSLDARPVLWPNSNYSHGPQPEPPGRAGERKVADKIREIAEKVEPAEKAEPVDLERLRERPPIDRNVVAVGGNHPDTSHLMAVQVLPKSGTKRRDVWDTIHRQGDHGATDDEVEKMLEGLHQTVSATRNSLMHDGWVFDSGQRRPTRSGRAAIVWVAIEEQGAPAVDPPAFEGLRDFG